MSAMDKDTLEAFCQKFYCKVLVFLGGIHLFEPQGIPPFLFQNFHWLRQAVPFYDGPVWKPWNRRSNRGFCLSSSIRGLRGSNGLLRMWQVHLRLGSGEVAIYLYIFLVTFASFHRLQIVWWAVLSFKKCTRRYLLIWEFLCQAFPELSLRISRMLKARQLSLAFFDVKFSLLSLTKCEILGVTEVISHFAHVICRKTAKSNSFSWKFWYWTLWGTIQETLNFKKITEPPGSFKFCSWKTWLQRGLIVWPCDHRVLGF